MTNLIPHAVRRRQARAGRRSRASRRLEENEARRHPHPSARSERSRVARSRATRRRGQVRAGRAGVSRILAARSQVRPGLDEPRQHRDARSAAEPAAEEAFRKALEIDPDSADTLNNLAWLLYEEKRIDEAEPLARKAVITKAPDPWIRLDTLARILAARGACDEAAMTFRAQSDRIARCRSGARKIGPSLEEAASTIASCSPTAPTGPPPSTN
jgi:tetratricopeptide (TPR) repeat protein